MQLWRHHEKTLIFEPVELSAILKVLIPALDGHGYSAGLKDYGNYVRVTAKKVYSSKIDFLPDMNCLRVEILPENCITRSVKNHIFNLLSSTIINLFPEPTDCNLVEISETEKIVQDCFKSLGTLLRQ